jgi:hypothetical protein
LELGKHYIRSSSLIARLIERRDENPVAVDYDLDSDDDVLLDWVNRGGDDVVGARASTHRLSADQLEAAMRALEVESFALVINHVQVSARSTLACYLSRSAAVSHACAKARARPPSPSLSRPPSLRLHAVASFFLSPRTYNLTLA